MKRTNFFFKVYKIQFQFIKLSLETMYGLIKKIERAKNVVNFQKFKILNYKHM